MPEVTGIDACRKAMEALRLVALDMAGVSNSQAVCIGGGGGEGCLSWQFEAGQARLSIETDTHAAGGAKVSVFILPPEPRP